VASFCKIPNSLIPVGHLKLKLADALIPLQQHQQPQTTTFNLKPATLWFPSRQKQEPAPH